MLRLAIFGIFAATLIGLCEADGGGHDHVIIHVPYHIKTIKHTHTITKHIHHHKSGGDDYQVLGYTVGQPIANDGRTEGHEAYFSGGQEDWSGGNELIGGNHFSEEYDVDQDHMGY